MGLPGMPQMPAKPSKYGSKRKDMTKSKDKKG